MNRDKLHLLHIRENIAKIKRLLNEGKATFLDDEDKQAAILYYLQTLSESTTRLSPSLRDEHPQIQWQQIRGFRNRIVHDYLSTDLELVWLIITKELNPLLDAVEIMLTEVSDEQD
ncbi:MAG: HepT-like ribonuclease domain-containing protein [Chloroflexota bacterium]